MIEKIPETLHFQTGELGKTKFDIIPVETFAMACRKINEIIETLNDVCDCPKQDPAFRINLADARQEEIARASNWVGCMCKFWDTDDVYTYGILSSIDETSNYPFSTDSAGIYSHCAPIGADDVVIYKGTIKP